MEGFMKTVLQLNSSLFQEQGQSSQLTAALVSQLLDSQDRLIVRDLAAAPVPHLTAERFAAFTTAEDERTAALVHENLPNKQCLHINIPICLRICHSRIQQF